MKKQKLVAFAVVSSLTAATMLSAPVVSAKSLTSTTAEPAVAAANTQEQVFSAETIETDVAKALQAKGIVAKQPEPKKQKNPNSRPTHKSVEDRLTLNPTQNNLAILVKFPEENGHSPVPGSPDERIPAKYFNDLLYGTSYNPFELPQFTKYATAPNGTPAPTDRTLHNYYNEVSYGKLNVTTQDSPEKVGWVTAPHPYSYYFGDTGSLPTSTSDYNANGFGDYPHNVQGLVEDVVKAADPTIDFSKYADANGEVPGIFIIHEGTGGEWSTDPQQFWSHKWELNEPLKVDGVNVSKYSMEPEYGGNLTGFDGESYDPSLVSGPFAPAVGVYAHEFGHILGLPDLYDYGYDSEGVGAWSVMAGGSWARFPNYVQYNGNTPVQLDAWNRYFAGLADAVEINSWKGGDLSIADASTSNKVYKYTVSGTHGTEYFLLENRQLKGYDLGLARYGGVKTGQFNDKMHGLVVYHVDDNVLQRNFWRPDEGQDANADRRAYNPVDMYTDTNEWHYGVGIVQADGRFDLENNMNAGDAGDVFPGTSGKTTLQFGKDFYSGSYYQPITMLKLTDIAEKNGVITTKVRP
ncbi:M6 family metalloprotease domain-containing protein [Tumebacillus sp. ITR2]|uniref:M6 family metalloprotease domain-containing protein n=1 Tax=Tumebacillus amylolyticus TaxID=2801339 RepID=A0ABS1J562_9BACL|nr:M6 family metalloprotease domain-containing protein [Tumebacillus amylolyticus]MBL0385325.1 M6 family metalloprotease domain-containing protein [Tumebacillus amylolyticus]